MRHKEAFRVRFTEADHEARVTPVSMYNYFQETAVAHGEACGITPSALTAKGYAWILSRILIEFERYPKWGDIVTVETWGSSLQGLYAVREWRATTADGSAAARATSRWVLLDIARKRVVKLPSFLTDAYGEYNDRAVAYDFPRFGPAADAMGGRPLHVRRSDLDTNRHANSGCYVDWCVESVPQDVTEKGVCASLEVIYKKEAVLGDELLAAGTQNGETGVFDHSILRGNEVLAYGRSRWREI